MRKTERKILVGFSAVIAAVLLVGCGGGALIDNSDKPVFSGSGVLSRIELADGYQKTSYVVGEELCVDNMELVLHYTDGSVKNAAVTSDMVRGFDTSDFEVVVIPDEYEDEPILSEPTSKQTTLYFVNESCEELPVQQRIITKGERLTEDIIPVPHKPSNDVYFGGWYFDEDFYIPIDYETAISTITYIYAQWLPIDFSVIEADKVNRKAEIIYNGEVAEYHYAVYKDIGAWYFDFERDRQGAVIGENVDTVYEVGDEFSTRGLYMTGGELGARIMWGMPVNKGMVNSFDSSTPGNGRVEIEFGGRSFEYNIIVTEKSIISQEGVSVDDNGVLNNLSGSGRRFKLPDNAYVIPNDFSALLNAEMRYNVKEIACGDGVTRIGDGAFKDMKRLQSVTIGKNVLYIGDGAFGGCDGLREVYVYATEPPYIRNAHFLFDVGASVKIYVPCELIDDYVTSPLWCNYSKYIYGI